MIMKKFIVSLIIAFSVFNIYATDGFDVFFDQPANGVYELNFDLGKYDISQVTHDGITYSNIEFGSSVFTKLKGFAQLPYINANVMLAADKNVSLEIIEGEYEEYSLEYPMVPSRGVIYRNQDPSTIPYEISPGSFSRIWICCPMVLNRLILTSDVDFIE